MIGHGPGEEARLLSEIGATSFEELIAQVPADLRMRKPYDLPPAQSEHELRETMNGLARRNYDPLATPSFLGAGFYDHIIPAAIDQIVLRSEFYTAYTPYQAEVAQGTLASIFEFQTLISELTGLPVANASMYEGGSAAAEALLLAATATRKSKVLIGPGVSPRARGIIDAYFDGSGYVSELAGESGGRLDLAGFEHRLAAGDIGGVLVQQPNFFGLLEPLDRIGEIVRNAGAGAHFVVSADPLSLAVLAAPADCGATSAVGDLQPLGIPAQFGGPSAGYFATRAEHVRRVPGRLVASARDAEGRRGFVLTLQTREQHIRREKATSNICTNSALMALRATIFMALLGSAGLREMATLCAARARSAARELAAIPGVKLAYDGPYWREFTVRLPIAAETAVTRVYEQSGILAGVPLSRFWPERANDLLVAVTEKRTPADIAALRAALARAVA